MAGTISWMFAGRADDPTPYWYHYNEFRSDNDQKDYRGSCQLSKIVGPNLGVSKNADVTIVKLPPPKHNPAPEIDGTMVLDYPSTRMSLAVDGLTKILEDVVAKGLGRKAVISLPLGFTETLGEIPRRKDAVPYSAIGTEYRLYRIVKELLRADVIIVVPAGNRADVAFRNGWVCEFSAPQIFSKLTGAFICRLIINQHWK